MGVFDKIKNALFEEEYVEVEEKPQRQKKERPKKEFIKEKVEERPIAKKVVLPEKRENRIEEIDEEDLIDEDFEIKPKVISPKREEVVEKDFKIMEDEDFAVVEPAHVSEPQIVKVIEQEEVKPMREEPVYYRGKPVSKQPYGLSDDSVVPVREYGGAYEKKEDKKQFKPSPIISPIYGVLDKNYKKEDVVSKKEVRITSSYARENLNFDDVRKKAYGTLNDDLVREIETEKKPDFESHSFDLDDTLEDDGNLLVDLSTDEEKPAVKEVTMGDALEYFQDLGLEYNVDYVDASKEKATGRRARDSYEEEFQIDETTTVKDVKKYTSSEEVEEKLEKKEKPEKRVASTKNDDVDVESDDNLFDLIDSMYREDE